jgi:cholesterol transport system auxiliary component
MIPLKRFARLASVAAVAVALSGCISLFPKSKPAQLYRFDYAKTAEAPTPPGSTLVGILKLNSSFTKAATGDRILTVTGGSDVAYIAEARWASPASVLFDEAVDRAFLANPKVRLINRGEVGKADYVMKLDVTRFEVDYAAPKATPEVLVSVTAALTRSGDRTLVSEQTFTRKVRAGGDRQAPIVGAFGTATEGVLDDVVGWAASNTAAP